MKEEERFWSKVKITTPDECWEWQDGKQKSLGYFKTELEAAKVYDDFTKEFHGDYHRPNIKD